MNLRGKNAGTRTLILASPYVSIVATMAVFVGFHVSALQKSAEQFGAEFRAAHLREINSGEIYSLVPVLSRLGAHSHVTCARATRGGSIFYEHGICGRRWASVLSSRASRVKSDAGDLEFEFRVGLPAETERLYAVVGMLLLLILATVFWSSRRVGALAQADRVAFAESEVARLRADLLEETKRGALAHLASQVAHDIRSPLSALDVMLGRLQQLPEEERVLIRGAVHRIRDIANNLLATNRGAPSRLRTPCLLSNVIEAIVSEKRTQYRARMGIAIEAPLNPDAYGLFAEVDSVELGRALSNLINNSVEALVDGGHVTVTLDEVRPLRTPSVIAIRIEDDGPGIAPEVLARLGEKGFSHGKEEGSGLGLHHARRTARAFGGALDIQSRPGQGTTVTLTLPKVPTPSWFVSRLSVPDNARVVVVDDDQSIHRVWRDRFLDRPLVHLSTPDELRDYVSSLRDPAGPAVYLVDHEFVGFPDDDGISLIRELGLAASSVLVTSRFEEPAIMERCLKSGIRMIPKGLVGFVPIEMLRGPAENPSRPDAILIDDDPLVHAMWNWAAKRSGHALRIFERPDDFFTAGDTLDRAIPLYVDVNLAGVGSPRGSEIRGEEVAVRAIEMGFRRVFLATGESAESCTPVAGLSGVRSKTPPF